MHPNQTFRQAEPAQNLEFVRQQGFGTLIVATDTQSLVSHVPFWIADDGQRMECHLVRSNPIARALDGPVPAVVAVAGPHGYISPDWYGHDDQVPTWNYVAVHLRGSFGPMPVDQLRPHLDRLSAQFEARLAPKTPWTTGKMTPDALDRMMRQIVPFEMQVTDIDGTWKLGQNKPGDARVRAGRALVETPGAGQMTELLGSLMQKPPC